jgi:hypothetical protein
MTGRTASGLRVIDAPFVAQGPTGVAVRTRLHVTADEDAVLREVGTFLGSLPGRVPDQPGRRDRHDPAPAVAADRRQGSQGCPRRVPVAAGVARQDQASGHRGKPVARGSLKNVLRAW